ncbi:MAG: outer membrane beta-barrel protein [Schleiferiaceae bacterium]|nr:outer membrane beta-barrel protein [Schleiferiaceae bacterium]
MRSAFLALLGLAVGLGNQSLQAQIKAPSRDVAFYDAYAVYLQGADRLDQAWWSNGHNFSLVHEFLYRERFGLAAGLGYSWQNFHNNMMVQSNPGGEERYFTVGDTAYNRMKLSAHYLYLPVEVRFRTDPNKQGRFWRLYLGARLAWHTQAYHLLVDEQVKRRTYRLDELADWRSDAYLRLGYGPVSLYAQYDLTGLFGTGLMGVGNTALAVSMDTWRVMALGMSVNL